MKQAGTRECLVCVYIYQTNLLTDTLCSQSHTATQHSLVTTHPAMKTSLLLLVLAAAAAVKLNSTTPSTAEDDRSLLSSLLQASGFSQTCIAGALDHCSTGHEDGHFVSLLEVRVPTLCRGEGLLCMIFPKVTAGYLF